MEGREDLAFASAVGALVGQARDGQGATRGRRERSERADQCFMRCVGGESFVERERAARRAA
jgi:hypothetical protein